MAPWTLETARQHLNAWLSAEMSVSSGQSYRMGTRQLERANLSEIRQQIKYWRREVERLESKSKSTRRVIRVIPRDL